MGAACEPVLAAARRMASWLSFMASSSGDDGFDHFPVIVRQAEVAAVIAVSQLFVIKAEQPENSGMQIMNVDLVLDGTRPKLVGCPIDSPAFNSAAGQP